MWLLQFIQILSLWIKSLWSLKKFSAFFLTMRNNIVLSKYLKILFTVEIGYEFMITGINSYNKGTISIWQLWILKNPPKHLIPNHLKWNEKPGVFWWGSFALLLLHIINWNPFLLHFKTVHYLLRPARKCVVFFFLFLRS